MPQSMRPKVTLVAESAGNGFTRPFRRRLNRRAVVSVASQFTPHTGETPETHFPLQTVNRLSQPRFINRYDSKEILVVVDGSCLNNGNTSYSDVPSSGGCSFIYKGGGTRGPATSYPFLQDGTEVGGTIGFPLEHCGPGGELHDPTSNRAKLRAVIAALEFRPWHVEGWHRIVIATNLKYVVDGAVSFMPLWVRRRWRSARGGRRMVANRDLWEELHGAIENLRKHGTEVSFWLITRKDPAKNSEVVQDARNAAQEAAWQYDEAAIEFTRLCGIHL
ncbi:hypothetical protein BKA67DRAFT_398129 [Truncatella angustata]|uniref:RNase H type-1 domain-containing protein n=1 Tax=Truncatella angustata TaxID=152316 RepID=A0A9P8RP57_9PEZI|nr:uncharacterized protein BKA67DRAFT_398129 [Truncatella angustata]KAH6647790.1 hypothetical protein BKA67DRAFT_398129 [Truncatella angustata]KAH8202018.1 hypothetical protein TruAng_003773 [Truncatella angustata]